MVNQGESWVNNTVALAKNLNIVHNTYFLIKHPSEYIKNSTSYSASHDEANPLLLISPSQNWLWSFNTISHLIALCFCVFVPCFAANVGGCVEGAQSGAEQSGSAFIITKSAFSKIQSINLTDSTTSQRDSTHSCSPPLQAVYVQPPPLYL